MTDPFQGLNPLSKHFSQICVSDLILVNEEGEVVIGDEPINAAAFAIHSEIHKARPDVDAACHAHSVVSRVKIVGFPDANLHDSMARHSLCSVESSI